MPRPSKPTEIPFVYANHGKKHPLGHVFTIYSDNAVYDETLAKFITPETLVRAS